MIVRRQFHRHLRLHRKPVFSAPGAPLYGFVLALCAISTLAACSGAASTDEPVGPTDPAAPGDGSNEQVGTDTPKADEILPVPPITKTSLREHPAHKAYVYAEEIPEGTEMELGQAEARGLTLVDLSDNWKPYIFTNQTPGEDDGAENTYASRYTDLANNRTDADGDPLPEHKQNFLELYGIPPTLSVVMQEFEQVGEIQTCLDEAQWDPSVFGKLDSGFPYRRKGGKSRVKKARWYKKKIDAAMKKAKIEPGDYEAASSHDDTKALYDTWQGFQREVDVVAHTQIRLRCEKLFSSKDGLGKFESGNFDSETTHALAAFEKKHDVMGWGHFTLDNLEALEQSPLQSAYSRLVRVVRARAVSAAGVVEDGSAAAWKSDFRYKDAEGKEHGLRDMVTEVEQATLTALGLDDPESAYERLQQISEHSTGDGFENVVVAVALPERPAYYGPNMEFETVIDRGDVWYDFPYDDEGNKLGQPRKRRPKLTLYVRYEDQRIPLVHWGTTIGSWRSEEHDGKEYFAYKNSDVGERVWKDIVAAPVWIPPKSTPTRTLVKRKWKDGKLRTVVNYDETGPSYTSAYGLVAAYHIRQVTDADGEVKRELDYGIRTHGSVDYMSILRRYSHGCHRLYNMNAVRLFSFVLQHRDYTRVGQTEVGIRRAFEYNGKSHRMVIDTRGYRYELVEPIPVTVTEGRVRGRRNQPYTELMPKPGVVYEDEAPEPTLTEEGISAPGVDGL